MAHNTGVRGMPNDWHRGGLPAWTYDNEELLDLEKEAVFRRNWLCVGHVSEIPEAGDYLSLDAADERALILRDREGEIRAFHNLCRHRGSRVVTEREGRCQRAVICPFHGWSYNLDGSLRAMASPRTFDRSHYYLDIAGHDKPVAVAEQNIEEDVDYAAEEHAKVWLSWKSSAVVLLPRE